MTGCCAWCGGAVPGQRRGRRGARVFCSQAHKAAFASRALEIGRDALDHAGVPALAVKRAYDWNSNSAGRSSAVPPSPSEALVPFVVRS